MTRSSAATPTTATTSPAYRRCRLRFTRPNSRRGTTMTTATIEANTTAARQLPAGAGGARLTRMLPLAGVVFAVVAMAGNFTIGDFPDTDTPISKLTTYYAGHHSQVGRGGALLGYSVIFFAVFGIALWER